jgi:heat shock protein HtpX
MTLYNHSDKNKRKTWFLLSSFLIFVIGIGYVFSIALEDPTIVYIAVFFSIISAVIGYWFSDKIVLSMSNASEIKFADDKELFRIVENLCITIGLPMPKIYVIKDPAPNAFATGRNPENSAIAVTTGLLDRLEKNEIEAVLAHELSHVKNYDILIATLATIMVGFVVILSDFFIRIAFFGRGGSPGGENKGNAKIILIIIAIAFSILAPIFSYMLQFAISRKREFLADADAALITRYPEALASALEKISSDPRDVKSVNRATAHLYISAPLKNKKKKFFAKAFMTHPPVDERIKALRGMKI